MILLGVRWAIYLCHVYHPHKLYHQSMGKATQWICLDTAVIHS